MYLIGLTGGIASGKSTIATRLAEHGAVVIDADVLSREVVEPGTPGLAAIAARFGADVIGPDGTLDRPALGAIVFSDEQARADLNAIVHPEVKRRSQARIAEASSDPAAIVVYDVPLLVETGRADEFDLVIVASAPKSVRADRLVELRGLDRGEAERRIASQATEAQRTAVADVVIDTAGTLAHTVDQVDAVWRRALSNGAPDEAPRDADV
ncbi:dephospho-CoA kinase [Plantibacter sp. Leaf171]|uniref:dephospho-CoA kinase n=1 Tax=unclassified Plantibacter TaxID=2624265 RepID=UPI0006F88788|nr:MULTISPECIES: dephospho-CoA kinase [unclassified Plantibacter]KQM15060.1 dephospho-CoA kinase [Plantibacter sp. Leaf1]KQR58203.1 dephospho-CoA kinase [Plantibacter sp. Leaf171]